MEIENTDVNESAETTDVTESTETPNQEGAQAPEVQAQAPAAPEVPALPAYSPDFKYVANGQERELDKRLQALVKSKEDEEWLKGIFKKHDGFDEVLQRRDQFKQQFTELSQEAQKVIGAVDQGNYGQALQLLGVDTKDISQVMQGLGFRKEDVIKYAYDLARLTPEQEAQYNKQRELETQSRQREQHAMTLEEKLHQADVRLRSIELKSALSTPEIASVAEAFDRHHGQTAFWNKVCERGEYYHFKGVDKTATELAQEVAKELKAFVQPQAPLHRANAGTPLAKPSGNVPVIPSVNGGAASPARKKVASLKDMRNLAAELED